MIAIHHLVIHRLVIVADVRATAMTVVSVTAVVSLGIVVETVIVV